MATYYMNWLLFMLPYRLVWFMTVFIGNPCLKTVGNTCDQDGHFAPSESVRTLLLVLSSNSSWSLHGELGTSFFLLELSDHIGKVKWATYTSTSLWLRLLKSKAKKDTLLNIWSVQMTGFLFCLFSRFTLSWDCHPAPPAPWATPAVICRFVWALGTRVLLISKLIIKGCTTFPREAMTLFQLLLWTYAFCLLSASKDYFDFIARHAC